jgi:tetratricopeptide (TPR) repeat protein
VAGEAERVDRPRAPQVPDGVLPADLDRAARSRLRTLSKENADGVARHLVMAGRLLDTDPELAYEHAQAAVRRAGRVDVVREAAGIAAYRTGRYAEALRELRTVRRLNGSDEHLALMADCERGLGRPERALALSREAETAELDAGSRLELALVVAGARLDLGEPEAALLALDGATVRDPDARARVDAVRVAVLEALGRSAEAADLAATLPAGVLEPEEEPVVVIDLEDDDLEDDDLEDDDRDTDGALAEPEADGALAETGPDGASTEPAGDEDAEEGR